MSYKPPMVLGIDPGVTGAFGVIPIGTEGEVQVWDIPSVKIGTRKQLEIIELSATMTKIYNDYDIVITAIEMQHARPVQGVKSAYTMGLAFGTLDTLLFFIQLHADYAGMMEYIKPQDWKKSLGLSKEKEASLYMARRLFPGASLERKKDHDRAEALLIAEYARRIQWC